MNVVDLELKLSVILIQCVLGRRRLLPTIREEEECIVATCQISLPLKKRKDSQKKPKRLPDKKK